MSSLGIILVGRNGADALGGLEATLSEEGYWVHSVDDGNTLISCMASEEPDLVIIDESIREMAPREIVLHARRRPGVRDVPILIFSSQARGEDAASAIRDGATDYIRMPFDLSEVLARVAGHMGRGQLVLCHHLASAELIGAWLKGDDHRVDLRRESPTPRSAHQRPLARILGARILRECQPVSEEAA